MRTIDARRLSAPAAHTITTSRSAVWRTLGKLVEALAVRHPLQRRSAADETIVFIHTGGVPAMFAYADHF
jgi:hypothetical protein